MNADTQKRIDTLLSLIHRNGTKPELKVHKFTEWTFVAELSISWPDNSNTRYYSYDPNKGYTEPTTFDQAIETIYNKVQEDIYEKISFYETVKQAFLKILPRFKE